MKALDNLVSPQALKVYKVISEHGEATAEDIARHLEILPNTVYRACKQLIDLGVVEKNDTYPVKFRAVASSVALGWFMLAAQRSFKKAFDDSSKKTALVSQAPSMSFIRNRPSLLAKTDKDIADARQDVMLMVSGLQVPDSTVLAYRKAVARGVSVRALIQRRKTSREKLERWRDIGVEVREIENTELRLFVIDSKIAYVTSYDEDRKEQAFGIRFDYPPFAILLRGVFEEKWKIATDRP